MIDSNFINSVTESSEVNICVDHLEVKKWNEIQDSFKKLHIDTQQNTQ